MLCSSKPLLDQLFVDNPAYLSALKSWRSVRFTPKTIPVFHAYRSSKSKTSPILSGDIPQALSGLYEKLSVLNKSTPVACSSPIPPIQWKLEDDQEKVVNDMLQHRYSYGKISTGVGKTWIIAAIAQRLQQQTLIVVHSTSALTQMVEDIKTIFGITPFIIGKKKSINAPIHIINIHSLDKAQLDWYGLVIYDEADRYLASDNYRSLLCRVQSYYQYAVTGTTILNWYPDKIFQWFYGNRYELIRLNLTPQYMQVKTQCMAKSFKNFADLMGKVYADEERNKLIVAVTHKALQSYNKAIVFCRGIEHSNTLTQMFSDLGYKTFTIIWNIPNDEREQIRKDIIAHKGKCILVGSVQCIGRWFNVPELDLAVLTSAEKFDANTQQFIGRVIRTFPWKTKCLFIDIVDDKIPMLRKQAKERLNTYKQTFYGSN